MLFCAATLLGTGVCFADNATFSLGTEPEVGNLPVGTVLNIKYSVTTEPKGHKIRFSNTMYGTENPPTQIVMGGNAVTFYLTDYITDKKGPQAEADVVFTDAQGNPVCGMHYIIQPFVQDGLPYANGQVLATGNCHFSSQTTQAMCSKEFDNKNNYEDGCKAGGGWAAGYVTMTKLPE